MFSPRIRTRSLVACLGFALLVALALTPVYAGGGDVLPPAATPHGYSLTDMAKAMAYFTTSGNNAAYYPTTPFQILYVPPNADPNTTAYVFDVERGTEFFVPVVWTDDTPPILGDFPQTTSKVAQYMFSPRQLGGHDVWIDVDGHRSPLGRAYVAGPVYTPGLLDGTPAGSHFIQMGAFLAPLSDGSHTVVIHGVFDGEAVLPVFGPAGLDFTITYEVIVH